MRKTIAVLTSCVLGLGLTIGNVSSAEASVPTNMVKYQPLPTNTYKVTSGYGQRTNPVTKKEATFHRGLDYKASCNTPIIAVMDGYISKSSWEENGFGWYVQVRNNNTSAMYAHMNSKSNLKIGTKVYAGQQIGVVGKTGMSTGCHTHLELRDHTVRGKTNYGSPFDPTPTMNTKNSLDKPITVQNEMRAYYKKNKANTGYPRRNQVKLSRPNGYYQTFEKGTLYSSPKTDPAFVKGGIRDGYKKVKYEKGFLGFPTSDETRFKYKSRAYYQNFQNGMLIWSRDTQGQPLKGAILSKWKADGWERSSLKLPKNAERCGLKNRGCYQTFQTGSVHWSSKTGAQITKGAIQKAWGQQKWENGKLGYPTSGEFKWKNKTRQNFQGGYITWTSKKGTQVYYR